jgi:hypothetical protein
MTEPTYDPVAKRWSDDAPITDAEKHAYCRRRWNHDAVFLSPVVYEAARRADFDMRTFVINQPIPVDGGTVTGTIMTAEKMKSQYAKGPAHSTFGPSSFLRWNDCPGATKKDEPDGGKTS